MTCVSLNEVPWFIECHRKNSDFLKKSIMEKVLLFLYCIQASFAIKHPLKMYYFIFTVSGRCSIGGNHFRCVGRYANSVEMFVYVFVVPLVQLFYRRWMETSSQKGSSFNCLNNNWNMFGELSAVKG